VYEPSAALRRLGRLTGTWTVTGGAVGTVTYEWMNDYFLLQRIELDHDGNRVSGLEVIGHLRPFMGEPSDDVMSRYYGSDGSTLDYVYEIDDEERRRTMKYIMLAYTSVEGWESVDYSSPEFLAMCQFYEDLGRELTATGELVSVQGLGEPAFTRTVRREGGRPMVLDGPYAEAKEVLASFSIVDVASHDRAMEIAARVCDAIGDTIEVRPLPDGPPGA
jgi:hypothetical protein